eukprot:760730-Prymnesium_polylepis.1
MLGGCGLCGCLRVRAVPRDVELVQKAAVGLRAIDAIDDAHRAELVLHVAHRGAAPLRARPFRGPQTSPAATSMNRWWAVVR